MQEIDRLLVPSPIVRVSDTLTRRTTSNNRPFLVRNSCGEVTRPSGNWGGASSKPARRRLSPARLSCRVLPRLISISILGRTDKFGKSGTTSQEIQGGLEAGSELPGEKRFLSGRQPGNSLPTSSPAIARRDFARTRADIDRTVPRQLPGILLRARIVERARHGRSSVELISFQQIS